MNLLPIILLFTLAFLLLFFFFLYPLFLLVKSLFDREMDTGAKLLMLGGSLFTFPIPSYIYSGFIKDGGFGKFMVVLNIVLILLVFGGAFVILGPQGISDLYRKGQSGQFNALIEQMAGFEGISPEQLQTVISAPAQKPQEDTYKGVNTYEIDETNVFGAGKNAPKVQTPNQSAPPGSAPAPDEDYPIPTDPSLRIIYATCISHTPEGAESYMKKTCLCAVNRMKLTDNVEMLDSHVAFCKKKHANELP